MTRTLLLACAISSAMIAPAAAADICGNGLDDDADGLADEGCYAALTTGVCESPLSCSDTGMISPIMGSLRYQLPPDMAPKVPYGSGIGLRRFYTSMYAPAAGAPVWRKPLGERWQHTYMTWLAKTGSPPSSKIVLHTNRGQDIQAAYASSSLGWDYYTPQTGFHAKWFRQRQAAPNEFQLRTLTGETLVYNSSGRLTEIWDTLYDSLGTPNKVLVAYDANGQVSTVTDASGKRRLLFAYTSNVLTSVQFQIFVSSWTTYHTTSYAFTSGRLTTVTIGGALAQTNVYTSSYLTQIQDATGKSLVTIAYNATAGKVARIDTPQGMLGFEYSSGRATCSGKTVVHFNRGNALSCNTDGNCGAGYLCGGKTGGGSTGVCFRAARCLTTASPSEDVVTGVAPLGPSGESCTGACTTVQQYLWSTGTGVLDNYAIQDPAGNFTTRKFDANGLVTQVNYGDPDSNPSNSNGARTEWRFYGNATYPGKVTEIRRKSDLATDASSCSDTSTAGCARTQFVYYGNEGPAEGSLKTVTRSGYTLNPDNAATAFSYTSTMTYDTKARLTQIDGPLTGSNDVTVFSYYTPSGALSDDFLDLYRRKKDASTFLDQRALAYDFRGNPTSLQDVDGTLTCLTFDAARGYLSERSEAMAGQATCTPNGADLVTKWTRDSAQRLVQLTRPDGSCVFFEYDSKGRLQRTKRRDDCIAASAGDRQEFVYDAEGLVTEVQIYDAASTLTAKQPFTYFDSRRLEKVINPVDVSKWTGIAYDARGLVTQLDAAGSLGKTVFNRTGTPGAEGRVTSIDKYKTSTTFDTWSLLYDWLGDQTSVTDGDTKVTQTVRDDLGRVVNLISPDMSNLVKRTYDEASRLVTLSERYGAGADQRSHFFTFDNLARPLDDDYAAGHSAGTCFGTTNPAEVSRVYDAPPVSCPIVSGCNKTAGRLAYVRARLMCSTGLGADSSLDQETFYSYDAAGRVVVEYIRDDGGRAVQQTFAWSKNGDLTDVGTPSSASINWSYGSGGSNSDTDLVTMVSRLGTGNPVVESVAWNPFGPLKSYKQKNTLAGVAMQTRITRNLAYRPTGLYTEKQSGGTVAHSIVLTEDAKGRVTARDYTSSAGGVQDSYFLYDDQDRVLCETTSFVTTCPTSGSTIKNNHSQSPPFTNAGDWKRLLRPIPGSTGLTHDFNPGGYGASHRITAVNQSDGTPTLGTTTFSYHPDGDRYEEYPAVGTNAYRLHYYDNRHNIRETAGFYRSGGSWFLYNVYSGYDDRGRRVYKSVNRNGTYASWFYYYDPLDRLTEVRYTPNTSSPSTYSVIQLFWLGDRLTAYWQTDYPAVTTTKRYVATDETNRPVEMWSWPASGDTTQVWAINPSAWGFDTTLVGSGLFQPVLFAGQYIDTENTAYQTDGTTVQRPALALNGFRTYDPFMGSYLQVDPLVPDTWSSYIYAESDPVAKDDPSGLAVSIGVSISGMGVTAYVDGSGWDWFPGGTCGDINETREGVDCWGGGGGGGIGSCGDGVCDIGESWWCSDCGGGGPFDGYGPDVCNRETCNNESYDFCVCYSCRDKCRTACGPGSGSDACRSECENKPLDYNGLSCRQRCFCIAANPQLTADCRMPPSFRNCPISREPVEGFFSAGAAGAAVIR